MRCRPIVNDALLPDSVSIDLYGFVLTRRQPKEIILAALAKTGEIAPAYIYLAFVLVYGTQVLHASRDLLLSGIIAGCLLSFFVTPLSGYLSDRIGRKRVYLIGATCMGVFGFIYFAC